MTDVASISGCMHKFCFDCIDKWAETENKCPLCKADFRTIDRVVALPPSSTEDAAANNMESARESSSDTSNCGPVNSRTVEDRSQGGDTPPLFVLALFDLAMSIVRSIEMEVLGLGISFEEDDLVIRVNTPSGWVDLFSIAAADSSDTDDSPQSESDDSINASEESGASSMSEIAMGIESLSTQSDVTIEP